MSITLTLIGVWEHKKQQTHPECSRDSSGPRGKQMHIKKLTGDEVSGRLGMKPVSLLQNNVLQWVDHKALQSCYCVDGDSHAGSEVHSGIKQTHQYQSLNSFIMFCLHC